MPKFGEHVGRNQPGKGWIFSILTVVLTLGTACGEEAAVEPEVVETTETPEVVEEVPEPEIRLTDPVPLWENGQITREIEAGTAADEGYLLLDLGEEWTPYLFSERDRGTGEANSELVSTHLPRTRARRVPRQPPRAPRGTRQVPRALRHHAHPWCVA